MAAEASAMSDNVFILVAYTREVNRASFWSHVSAGTSSPRAVRPTVRSSTSRYLAPRGRAGRAAPRAPRRSPTRRRAPGPTSHMATMSSIRSTRWRRRSTFLNQPLRYCDFTARLDRGQHAVHVLEIGVLAGALLELDPELAAGRDECDREVAVDVRAHPGQRELERRDPVRGALIDQRRPRAGHAGRVGAGCVEGAEEEVGEDDVEPREEVRIAEDHIRRVAAPRPGSPRGRDA